MQADDTDALIHVCNKDIISTKAQSDFISMNYTKKSGQGVVFSANYISFQIRFVSQIQWTTHGFHLQNQCI